MWLSALSLLISSAHGADIAGSGTLLAEDAHQLTVEIATDLLPGSAVAVYVSELRPDPRTGGAMEGLRYAGDGRIVWVGDGLVEIALVHPNQDIALGAGVQLGDPAKSSPTPAYAPPEQASAHRAQPVPEPEPPPEPEPVHEPEPAFAPGPEPESAFEVSLLTSLNTTTTGEELPASSAAYTSRYGDRRQSLRVGAGWSGDGFGSGAGLGGAAWRMYPERAVSLVEIGLDGLRSNRWVAADAKVKGEEAGLEPAVGYWLWTRVDTRGTGLAGLAGLAVGVDGSGLAMGFMVGVRTGVAHGDRIELTFTHRGALGGRLAMDGRVRLADPLRIGVRTRVGDLPKHSDDTFRQGRSDAALLLSADPSPWLTLEVAGGFGGYDLLFDDIGAVLDGALEIRW